jgi:flavin-dependent dehydrogenase
LDEALLRQAEAEGAVVLRGHRIGTIESGSELLVGSASLGCIAAETVFLATGKHELRGAARPSRGGHLLAAKMYYALEESQQTALRNHIELHLFAGGYAGLQLVEQNRAVLCVLLPAERLRAVGGRWDSLLDALMHECPLLGDRLAAGCALRGRPFTIAGLPYGYLHIARPRESSSLFRLGDQAAVIASLCGDGVALALASGSEAARTHIAGGDAANYHRTLAAHLKWQMRSASAMHRLCMTPALQPLVAIACRLWPGVMQLSARATRLTPALVDRSGVRVAT